MAPVASSPPARWTERVECGSCADTCWKFDPTNITCRGGLQPVDVGSEDENGDWMDGWMHYCENPEHAYD
jgi:hypothetical protein